MLILIHLLLIDLSYPDERYPLSIFNTFFTADEFNKSVELSCSGDTDSINSNNSKKTRMYMDAAMQGQGPGQGPGRGQHDQASSMMPGGGDQVRVYMTITTTDPCD